MMMMEINKLAELRYEFCEGEKGTSCKNTWGNVRFKIVIFIE